MKKKIENRDLGKYCAFGFTLGEKVIFVDEDGCETETQIVGIDKKENIYGDVFLLTLFSEDGGSISDLEDSDSFDIVYIKGAKKSEFNFWARPSELKKIKEMR